MNTFDLYEPEMRWLLRLLNLSGNNPVTGTWNAKSQKVQFNFRWKSCCTLVTAIGAVLALAIWLVYFVQIVLKWNALPLSLWLPPRDLSTHVKNPESNLSPSVRKGTLLSLTVVFSLMPLCQLLDIVSGWWRTAIFAAFFNNWYDFEDDYNETFHVQKMSMLVRWVPTSWRKLETILIATYVCVPAIFGSIFIYSSQKDHASFQILVLCYLSFRLNSVEMAADCISIVACRMISNAFVQIREGIEMEVKLHYITRQKAVNWRRLVQSVREQSLLFTKFLKPIQFHFLVRCFLLVTLFFLIALNVPPEGDDFIFKFHVTWATFGMIQIGRLYLKTKVADNISHSEGKIATLLASISTDVVDDSTVLQIKFTHDMILHSPCEIRFGKYLVFNQGLLLSMLGQVATYLIVLMQFVQT